MFPGDPIDIMLGPQAPEEARIAARERWGLDEPLYVQYFTYITNVLQGELGNSIHFRGVAV
jgi:peptide/nickel transport system permease protein